MPAPLSFRSPVVSPSSQVSRTVVTLQPFHSAEQYAEKIAKSLATTAYEHGLDSYDVTVLADDALVKVGVELTGDATQVEQVRKDFEAQFRAEDSEGGLQKFEDHEWFKR